MVIQDILQSEFSATLDATCPATNFQDLEKHITERGFKYTKTEIGENIFLKISNGKHTAHTIYPKRLSDTPFSVAVIYSTLRERLRPVNSKKFEYGLDARP